ncbi:hypothetical protein [Paracidovorax cattleyae]|nr:hypothetical protein [Paracidovorax cattleyae]UYL85465.1 hypothetical protein gp10c [Acidovorax phage Aval]
MIACTVKVAGQTYTGVFLSTAAAVIDAMQRFPSARAVSVRAAP